MIKSAPEGTGVRFAETTNPRTPGPVSMPQTRVPTSGAGGASSNAATPRIPTGPATPGTFVRASALTPRPSALRGCASTSTPATGPTHIQTLPSHDSDDLGPVNSVYQADNFPAIAGSSLDEANHDEASSPITNNSNRVYPLTGVFCSFVAVGFWI